MKKNELEKILKDIRKKHADEIIKIKCNYARGNQKYNIGDILKSSNNIILVTKIGIGNFNYYGDETEVYYIGKSLRKSDLNPYKNGDYGTIYQSSVEEKIVKGDGKNEKK